jgi:hypothetical protein
MNDIDQLKGTPFDERTGKKKLPGSLNTLTILTFIGCGLGILSTLYNQMNAKKNLDLMEKMQGSEEYDKLPDFAKKFYSPEAIEIARLSYENRIPLLIITVVSLALCLYGAIQMRGLKKQGYYLWLIGEILPLVSSVVFVGIGIFSNFVGIIILAITALFIFLYTLQLKYLS